MKNTCLHDYIAEYKNILPDLPCQSLGWLKTLRHEALEYFIKHGFPSCQTEEWRYTDVSALEKKLFSPQLNTAEIDIDKQWVNTFLVKNALTVVLVNGVFSKQLSSLSALPKDVLILSMANAIQQQPDLVKKYFAKAVNNEKHGFIALNSAWFSDGLFVHVPVNQVIQEPIQILHVVTKTDLLAVTRNMLIVDEMAKVSVIETFIGLNNAYLAVAVNEVFIAKNTDLTLYTIQEEGNKAYHFGGTYVQQAKGSRFTHHNFAFGGLLARNDIHIDLDVDSKCDLNGLYLGINRQHIDNHTYINHGQPNALSKELYKGVLNQRSRGVFQGRIAVAKNAQQTNAQMHNHNLLLSDNAEVDTKPQLEIYANDVKCTHGVTVGQLNEKLIFYLQSRGIDAKKAKDMLVLAFTNEMINKVKPKGLGKILGSSLTKRFNQQAIST